MAYYYNQQSGPKGLNNPVMSGDVQRSILKAYVWMFVGLLVTAAVSFGFLYMGGLNWMYYRAPALFTFLPLVGLGIVIGFSFAMRSASPTTLKVLFLAYAVTLGINFTTFLASYTPAEVCISFLVCAVYFGSLVMIGLTTKRDLTGIGTICLTALVVGLIGSFIFIIFRISTSTWLISLLTLLIFTGLTAWDCQRINQIMLQLQGQPDEQERWAIYFALTLYLDFINIYIRILSLIGRSNRRN